MPKRKGVPYAEARANVDYWLNVYGDWRDFIIRLGRLGDRAFGWSLEQALADRNEGVGGAGHSSLLMEPKHLGRWYGWTAEVAEALQLEPPASLRM